MQNKSHTEQRIIYFTLEERWSIHLKGIIYIFSDWLSYALAEPFPKPFGGWSAIYPTPCLIILCCEDPCLWSLLSSSAFILFTSHQRPLGKAVISKLHFSGTYSVFNICRDYLSHFVIPLGHLSRESPVIINYSIFIHYHPSHNSSKGCYMCITVVKALLWIKS